MFKEICKIAKDAGNAIIQVYISNKIINISYKNDNSPVTHADHIANKIIKDRLSNIYPNIPILSEEDSNNIKYNQNWDIYWLVDPLDGTKEFLKKNGEFTVNISLIEHGIPIIGVVYAPYFNVLYYAFEKKSWKINKIGEKKQIFVNQTNIPKYIISRSHPNKKLHDFLKNKKKYTIKKLGSSLKFCYVAEGKAQIYPRFGKTHIWDTAAGHAIVTGAGGKVITYSERKNLNYFLSSKVSLINPDFLVLS
ncbi:3'(2'),5'-bisphosphate nucleotidase CysQ [Buchnera aphidicola]|uniref:3'(2'),5'-bisphosphate nucleotidase CysQ n=1 Tax=Buchnera aphidicola (Aphis nerii) TaxID=1241835 RepID=A0A4D6XY62_9GAMM|nr:3'(2'),5'-bisphosphate nucleotidase CysQ [Buchnera aphidicola]QCI19070.1 3'(2'),5'-bisphosphate nucleotidase [Buchnera aphidicola (Aphis nerii)]